MIGSTRNIQVYVYTQPTDMRLGFDGLYALVRNNLKRNPLTGDVYLFISKNRKRAKALMWDGTGLCLYCKRLEKGLFAKLFGHSNEQLQLTLSELQLFFEGSTYVGKNSLSPSEYRPNIVA